MKIMILNGSPKTKGGASRFFSDALKLMIGGCEYSEYSLKNKQNYKEIFSNMKIVDSVVLSVPLYVDGIPSHVIGFLKEAETFCKENNSKFKLYVISNNGFVEGRQNKSHIEQYQCWCERADVAWGGAVGIGGGVMLNVIIYAQLGSRAVILLLTMIENFTASLPLVNNQMILSVVQDIAVLLFLFSGMLFCFGRLAGAIKKGDSVKTMYTRVMLPSFVFLIISDIFMFLSFLLNGGNVIVRIFHIFYIVIGGDGASMKK